MSASILPHDAADGLCALSATKAVELLKQREVSPSDLVDAAIARIEAVDPVVNALPLRCFEAARKQY